MTTTDLGFVHRFVRGREDETLLLLHGTGGDENDLIPLGGFLRPGANFLSPRGSVLENGMPRFFKRLAMGVFDIPDLKKRTAELARFLQSSAEAYEFDLTKVVAVGYSNGANIAASLILTQPSLLRAAALLHAMVPFVPETMPDLEGTSILITGGNRDPIVPRNESEALAALLGEAGADVDLHFRAGGHELTQDEADYVRQWLERVFK